MLRRIEARKAFGSTPAGLGARGLGPRAGLPGGACADTGAARRAGTGRRWRIPAVVLIVTLGSLGRSASVDVEKYEKTVEARKFVETFGFIDLYRAMQKEFLTKLDKAPEISGEHSRAMSAVLDESDYLGQLAEVAGMYLTRADLIAINQYFAEGVGQREWAMSTGLEQMLRRGELEPSEAPASSAAFYESLSNEDRAQVMAFRQSPAGKRFVTALAAIREKVGLIFLANLKAAIPEANDRVWEQGRNLTARPPPAANIRPTTTIPARPPTAAVH